MGQHHFSEMGGTGAKSFSGPVVMGDEELMKPKAHGTSETPVQKNLKWECDWNTADRICNFNRHYAEHSGYFQTTAFLAQEKGDKALTFFGSNSGKPLFVTGGADDRSWDSFVKESKAHGWPSFRDNNVNWDNVRVLPNGEVVSVDGTHLGHNLPDHSGNRYCINLVCVAGNPPNSSMWTSESLST